MVIYLDNNATTPVAKEVAEAFSESLQLYGNPSSVHCEGRKAKKVLEASRDRVAAYLKVYPSEIIFTSSGTEGINMLLRGFFEANPKGHLITSAVEHAAVLETAKVLEEKKKARVTYLKPSFFGAVTAEQVLEAITPDTKLIFLMAVNNETGCKTDLEAIGAVATAHNIPFFVDGVQLLGKALFTLPSGVDAMVFSGHKIHAPKGVGAVFLKKHIRLESHCTGGHQEHHRRAGTENVPGIVAFAKAVQLLEKGFAEAISRQEQLRDFFEQELQKMFGERVVVNGTGPRIANTSNVAFLGEDGEGILQALDMQRICVSLGSACASGALEPSHVLLGMGYSKDHAKASLRFSLSRYTTKEEIVSTLEILQRLHVK